MDISASLAFPTLTGPPAARVSFKPGRSGTLEPEVEDEKEGKNGLQARIRNQGNRLLKVIKGLYLEALKQNPQEPREESLSSTSHGHRGNHKSLTQ